MSSTNEVGVNFLIQEAKAMSRGSAGHQAVLLALGAAGGPKAVAFLIAEAKAMSKGSAGHQAAVTAIGRASRMESDFA